MCALLAAVLAGKQRLAPGAMTPSDSTAKRARLVDASPVDARPRACADGADVLLTESSDAVALILRGEAFRGFTLGLYVEDPDAEVDTSTLRRGIVCAPSARAAQRALAKNHVARLIEPLEARGVRVDVYLASYGCEGVPGVSEDVARRWWAELISWYDGSTFRVKAAAPLPRAAGQTQRTLVSYGVDAALRSGVSYRSFIVWRFDQAALADVEGPARRGDDEPPTGYLEADQEEGGVVASEQGWSAPWRFACGFGALMRADDATSCWRPDYIGHLGRERRAARTWETESRRRRWIV